MAIPSDFSDLASFFLSQESTLPPEDVGSPLKRKRNSTTSTIKVSRNIFASDVHSQPVNSIEEGYLEKLPVHLKAQVELIEHFIKVHPVSYTKTQKVRKVILSIANHSRWSSE